MSEEQNIENLFKDRFDNFKPEVNSSVWNNIAQQLPAAAPVSHGVQVGAKGLLKSLSIKTVITVVTTIVIITSAIVYFSSEKKSEVVTKETQLNIQQEEPKTATIQDNALSSPAPIAKINQAIEKQNLSKSKKPAVNNSNSSETNLSESISNSKVENSPVKENGTSETVTQPAQNLTPEKSSPKNADVKQKENPESSNANATSDNNTPIGLDKKQSECDKFKKNIPNSFSPNGDGNNDQFYLSGLDENSTSLKVEIYQNGKLIYEWDGVLGSWDGTMKDGSPASVGDYVCFYSFEIKNGERCTGFTPVRIFR